MTPRRDASGKWILNVPAAKSSTGKRQRLFFDTRKAAEIEAERIKGMANQWGSTGRKIKASLAEDAAKAAEILEGAGIDISLYSLARAEVERHQFRGKSVSLDELFRRFKASREKKSDIHQRSIRKTTEKISETIGGGVLVCDLDHSTLRDAINESYRTPHSFNFCKRTISPAFSMAVREGWTTENPFDRIETMDTGRHEVKIPPLNSIRKLMTSFEDYTEKQNRKGLPELREDLQVDCTGAMPAIALMAFCGVRPGGEIGRLSWENIDMNERTAFIENTSAKTNRSRLITLTDTAFEWLSTVPVEDRQGMITPTNWKRVWQALRIVAGIRDYTDGLRKACATAHLLAFGDIAQTRALIGHEVGDTIFNNYKGHMSKRDALAYWNITPTGTKVQLKAVS